MNSRLSVDDRINFNLPLPVLLGSFLMAFLILPICIALLSIWVYQAIYDDVRRDVIAMMESRERSRPIVQPVQPVQSAPVVHRPSPFEPVCRDHHGIQDVAVLWRSGPKQTVKVTCHDGFVTLQ